FWNGARPCQTDPMLRCLHYKALFRNPRVIVPSETGNNDPSPSSKRSNREQSVPDPHPALKKYHDTALHMKTTPFAGGETDQRPGAWPTGCKSYLLPESPWPPADPEDVYGKRRFDTTIAPEANKTSG